jgi:hypothetical protein
MSGTDPEERELNGDPNVGHPQPPPFYGNAGPVNEDRREPVGFAPEVQQTGGGSPLLYRNYDPNVVFGLPAHPQATTILILGVLGLVILVTAPAAWIMGNKARKEMRQFPGRYQETSSLTVGWVLGIIGTAGLVLFAFAFAVIIFGAIVVAFTTS